MKGRGRPSIQLLLLACPHPVRHLTLSHSLLPVLFFALIAVASATLSTHTDEICGTTLVAQGCPAWLQGSWEGFDVDENGDLDKEKPWTFALHGEVLRLQGFAGSISAECEVYCQATSTPGVTQLDILYKKDTNGDQLSGFVQRSVIRPTHDGNYGSFEWTRNGIGECSHPPEDELFTANQFYNVRLTCASPPLVDDCPVEWLAGDWAGVALDPESSGSLIALSGGNADNSTLEVAKDSFLMTLSSENSPRPSVMRCSAADANGVYQRDLLHSDGSAYSGMVERGIWRKLAENGSFVATSAPPGWCLRPSLASIQPPITPLNRTEFGVAVAVPDFRIDQFTCDTPLLSENCPYELQGEWLGGRSPAVQENEFDEFGTGLQDQRNFVVIGRDVITTITDGDSTVTFTGILRCSASPILGSSSTYEIDIIRKTPVEQSGWRVRGLLKLDLTKETVELVEHSVGFCSRPDKMYSRCETCKITDYPIPSPAERTELKCGLPALVGACPYWLEGIFTGDEVVGYGWQLEGKSNGGHSVSFSRENWDAVWLRSGETRRANVACAKISAEEYSLDVTHTSPEELTGYTHRMRIKLLSDNDTFAMVQSEPGMCSRPSSIDYPGPVDGVLQLNSLYLFECATPPLTFACPAWMAGTWAGVESAQHDDSISRVWGVTIEPGTEDDGAGGVHLVARDHYIDGVLQGEGSATLRCNRLTREAEFIEGPKWEIDWRTSALDGSPRVRRGVMEWFEGTIDKKELNAPRRGSPFIGMVFGPPGKCARPPSEKLLNEQLDPYTLVNLTCATPLLTKPCPAWLTGRWTVSSAAVAPYETMVIVDEVYSSNYLGYGDSLEIDSEFGDDTWTTARSTWNLSDPDSKVAKQYFEDAVYNTAGRQGLSFTCSDAISTGVAGELSYDLDLMYTDSSTRRSGWRERARISLRERNGTFASVSAPPNWCHRPTEFYPPAGSTAVPNGAEVFPAKTALYKCSTQLLTEKCPGWLLGTWRGNTLRTDVGGPQVYGGAIWQYAAPINAREYGDNFWQLRVNESTTLALGHASWNPNAMEVVTDGLGIPQLIADEYGAIGEVLPPGTKYAAVIHCGGVPVEEAIALVAGSGSGSVSNVSRVEFKFTSPAAIAGWTLRAVARRWEGSLKQQRRVSLLSGPVGRCSFPSATSLDSHPLAPEWGYFSLSGLNVAIPDAPRNVTLETLHYNFDTSTADARTSVVVRWRRGAEDGGGIITHYRIQWGGGDGAFSLGNADVTTNTSALLRADCLADGNEAICDRTLVKSDFEDRPSLLSGITDTSRLIFTQPNIETAELSFVINGLVTGSELQVRILAHNREGDSEWSSTKIIVDGARGVPSAPSKVSLRKVMLDEVDIRETAESSLLVEWEPPINSYGSVVTSYRVEWSPHIGSFFAATNEGEGTLPTLLDCDAMADQTPACAIARAAALAHPLTDSAPWAERATALSNFLSAADGSDGTNVCTGGFSDLLRSESPSVDVFSWGGSNPSHCCDVAGDCGAPSTCHATERVCTASCNASKVDVNASCKESSLWSVDGTDWSVTSHLAVCSRSYDGNGYCALPSASSDDKFVADPGACSGRCRARHGKGCPFISAADEAKELLEANQSAGIGQGFAQGLLTPCAPLSPCIALSNNDLEDGIFGSELDFSVVGEYGEEAATHSYYFGPSPFSSRCVKHIAAYCLFWRPLDPGCTRPDIQAVLGGGSASGVVAPTGWTDIPTDAAFNDSTTNPHINDLTHVHRSASYSFLIKDLVPRLAYYIRVRAFNDLGAGEIAARTMPLSIEPLVVAHPPIGVVVEPVLEVELGANMHYYHFIDPNPGSFTTHTPNREFASTSLHVRFSPDPLDVYPSINFSPGYNPVVLRYKIQWDEANPSDGRYAAFEAVNRSSEHFNDGCYKVYKGLQCFRRSAMDSPPEWNGTVDTRFAFEGVYNQTPYGALGEHIISPLELGPDVEYNYTITGLISGVQYSVRVASFIEEYSYYSELLTLAPYVLNATSFAPLFFICRI